MKETISKFLKDKKPNSLPWIILAVIIFSFLFYWFQYRPTSIRKRCHELATEAASIKWKKENAHRQEEDLYYRNDYDYYYERCLRVKGLK
jgi:hypothetical protein